MYPAHCIYWFWKLQFPLVPLLHACPPGFMASECVRLERFCYHCLSSLQQPYQVASLKRDLKRKVLYCHDILAS